MEPNVGGSLAASDDLRRRSGAAGNAAPPELPALRDGRRGLPYRRCSTSRAAGGLVIAAAHAAALGHLERYGATRLRTPRERPARAVGCCGLEVRAVPLPACVEHLFGPLAAQAPGSPAWTPERAASGLGRPPGLHGGDSMNSRLSRRSVSALAGRGGGVPSQRPTRRDVLCGPQRPSQRLLEPEHDGDPGPGVTVEDVIEDRVADAGISDDLSSVLAP